MPVGHAAPEVVEVKETVHAAPEPEFAPGLGIRHPLQSRFAFWVVGKEAFVISVPKDVAVRAPLGCEVVAGFGIRNEKQSGVIPREHLKNDAPIIDHTGPGG